MENNEMINEVTETVTTEVVNEATKTNLAAELGGWALIGFVVGGACYASMMATEAVVNKFGGLIRKRSQQKKAKEVYEYEGQEVELVDE